jgi:hypothetical protein
MMAGGGAHAGVFIGHGEEAGCGTSVLRLSGFRALGRIRSRDLSVRIAME